MSAPKNIPIRDEINDSSVEDSFADSSEVSEVDKIDDKRGRDTFGHDQLGDGAFVEISEADKMLEEEILTLRFLRLTRCFKKRFLTLRGQP